MEEEQVAAGSQARPWRVITIGEQAAKYEQEAQVRDREREMRVRVADANATYPVRIDPTFSDADWVSLNSGIPGADGCMPEGDSLPRVAWR